MLKRLILLLTFFTCCKFVFAQGSGVAKKNYVKTNPNMLFCGKNDGFILLDSLKGTPVLSVPVPYTLISTTLILNGAGFSSPKIATLFSGPNSRSLRLDALGELLKQFTVGTKIAFLNIKIKKDKIIYDAPDMIFIVKDKL